MPSTLEADDNHSRRKVMLKEENNIKNKINLIEGKGGNKLNNMEKMLFYFSCTFHDIKLYDMYELKLNGEPYPSTQTSISKKIDK